MLYLLIKAVHITAAIIWIGSLFLLTYITSSNISNRPNLSSSDKLAVGHLKLIHRVTEAGIGLTWLAGIAVVILGGWYTSTWWQIKLLLVVLISAIHTIMHRRWQQQADLGAQTNATIPWVLLCLTLLVVSLAVFKRP